MSHCFVCVCVVEIDRSWIALQIGVAVAICKCEANVRVRKRKAQCPIQKKKVKKNSNNNQRISFSPSSPSVLFFPFRIIDTRTENPPQPCLCSSSFGAWTSQGQASRCLLAGFWLSLLLVDPKWHSFSHSHVCFALTRTHKLNHTQSHTLTLPCAQDHPFPSGVDELKNMRWIKLNDCGLDMLPSAVNRYCSKEAILNGASHRFFPLSPLSPLSPPPSSRPLPETQTLRLHSA